MELIPPTQDADWFNGLDNISEHPQLTSHPATYSGVAASPVPYPNNQFSGLADTPGLSGLDVPLSFPYPGVAASSVPFAIGRPNNDQLMISGLANAPQFSGLANTSDLFGLDVPFSIPDPDVYPSSVASPVSFGRHQNSFSPTSTPMQFQNFLPVSTLAHADSLWHDVGPISEEQCSDLNYGESSTYNRQYEPLPSNLPTLLSASGYSLEEEAPIVTCQENTPSQLQLGGFVCLNHCDGKFMLVTNSLAWTLSKLVLLTRKL
jgi:hypothetical protein